MLKSTITRVAMLAALLALFALVAPTLFAQSTLDGAIGGTVTDQTNAVVAGAKVTVRNLETNEKFNGESDSNGSYRVTHLRPGTYEVTITSGSFATFKADRIVVEVGRVTSIEAKMNVGGKTETELRYQHYSVVMSRKRRMCFFSACNIDGQNSRKSPRAGWKWDPRIPKAQQIMKECYGSPPKFSRGHMTRREDPGWGPPTFAKRGNEDSMHVTNVVPQMQAFNAPIWLTLEEYALQHAREDEMKISVFTGPYFAEGDPIMYGVRIPLAFWKVIAFIHDETGEPCATR